MPDSLTLSLSLFLNHPHSPPPPALPFPTLSCTLQILANDEGGLEGTLLEHLDNCETAFGKRLLRHWVSVPLANSDAINARLDAIENINEHEDLRVDIKKMLKKLPDIERLFSRIHAHGVARDKDAVMYTNVGKKKLLNFLKLLEGLKESQNVIETLKRMNLKSKILKDLADSYPNMREEIDYFYRAFNHKEAMRTGYITPSPGVDPEYDEAVRDIKDINNTLDSILVETKRQFGDKNIKFVHRNKETFQIEIKVSTLKTSELPDEFTQMSQTKTVKRFWTPRIKEVCLYLYLFIYLFICSFCLSCLFIYVYLYSFF